MREIQSSAIRSGIIEKKTHSEENIIQEKYMQYISNKRERTNKIELQVSRWTESILKARS